MNLAGFAAAIGAAIGVGVSALSPVAGAALSTAAGAAEELGGLGMVYAQGGAPYLGTVCFRYGVPSTRDCVRKFASSCGATELAATASSAQGGVL
jgi:hypothetical protein